MDLSGRVLLTQQVGIVPGVNHIFIDATLLPGGQYVVYVEMDGSLETKKVINY